MLQPLFLDYTSIYPHQRKWLTKTSKRSLLIMDQECAKQALLVMTHQELSSPQLSAAQSTLE